jgi:hypothetical protein
VGLKETGAERAKPGSEAVQVESGADWTVSFLRLKLRSFTTGLLRLDRIPMHKTFAHCYSVVLLSADTSNGHYVVGAVAIAVLHTRQKRVLRDSVPAVETTSMDVLLICFHSLYLLYICPLMAV